MKVSINEEAGYTWAARAFARSFEWMDLDGLRRGTTVGRAQDIMARWAWNAGDNKFLRFMWVWLTIEDAPREWWTQFVTHMLGVKSISPDDWTMFSQSTMHTLLKRPIVADDFDGFDDADYLAKLNAIRETGDIVNLKKHLPEGYRQTRDLCINYAALQNIAGQRIHHRNRDWDILIAALRGVQHPEFIFAEPAVRK